MIGFPANQTKTVTKHFDRKKLTKFKRAYRRAVKKGLPCFHFEDCEVVTDFAKYVIEYLEEQFRKRSSS